MTAKSTIRVRFAPAPTGVMHLGNIRAALMNFLFSKKSNGTFVLRIEDTDTERNYDPNATRIINHLRWFGLDYDEGPIKGGPHAPYFQSQRTALYEKAAAYLREKDHIYRCFCTPEELEKKRERQIALKLAPRYDRTCLHLDIEQIEKCVRTNMPFVWRMKLDHNTSITIHDLARGLVKFDLKNFSDFPISRSNGSFTFIFANFVDDMLMDITHIFRGEDHLSNSANQAALYLAFDKPLPIYYHLPILCNIHGQKLSKRDFGFSVDDIEQGGFLPEAVCNYLATLSGSFAKEIISFHELPTMVSFDNLHATGQVKYDEAKLRWFNHRWINLYDPYELTNKTKPFLTKALPNIQNLSDEKLTQLLQVIKSEMHSLLDAAPLLSFVFMPPSLNPLDFEAVLHADHKKTIQSIIRESIIKPETDDLFALFKKKANEQNIPLKELLSCIRLALTGSVKGLGIGELVNILGIDEIKNRLREALKIMH